MSNETSDPYLYFSSLAYDDPDSRQSSLENSSAYKHYIVDPSLNDAESFAAYNVRDESVIIGHRGTANLGDVQTDLGLAIGQLESTDRYQRSLEFAQRVKDKYNFHHIIHVGHSLGGTLADSIARRTDQYSVAYNRGSSPFEGNKPISEQHQHYRTSEDFISSFAEASGTKQTNTSKFGQRMQQTRDRLGSWGFLLPNFTANRTYTAYTGHVLNSFGNQ